MSIKSRLRPMHLRLRDNALYETAYLAVRPKARHAKRNTTAQAAKRPQGADAPKLSTAELGRLKEDAKASLVKDLVVSGDYVLAKSLLRKLIDEDGNTSQVLWAARAELALAEVEHDHVLDLAQTMTQRMKMPRGHYYAALSYFSRGLYADAMHHVQAGLYAEPGQSDTVYLLADIADRTGHQEMARAALLRLAQTSRRPKTWLCLANLTQSDDDYLQMQHAWRKWSKGLMKNAYRKDAYEYLALAAMRVGNYDLAKTIWRDSLMIAATKTFAALSVRKPVYSSNRAEVALNALGTTLQQAQIEMFLVSGTLLGCVREGRLLGHDKDIDVGIWDDVSRDAFFDAINTSGHFVILASRSEHIIRLKHLNGIAIDIFFHYRDPDDYWHAGVKMKWSNTPFDLEPREFLSQTHLIPRDFDLYLRENYGDWRTPMIAFDSAFDTPNGTILHEDEMVIHAFKGLQNSCIAGGDPTLYLDDLRRRGESDFVDRFMSQVKEHDATTDALITAASAVEMT